MKTKTHTTANRLIGLATAIALVTPAWASPVPIVNPGFEAQTLAENASTTPITGWTNIAGGASAFNPTATQFTNGSAEGNNVASIYEGADGQGISQILAGATGLFQADAGYVLTVKVGDAKDTLFDGYKIQLLADGTVLAQDDNTVAAIDDDFITATVNYTYDSGDAGLVGEPLEIRLLSKALGGAPGEVVFDDVQLTLSLANPVADPGSYSFYVGDSLSLDGSNSQPSDGETITTYEWDLNNDGLFDELVTGATPAAIPYATLTGTHGMVVGPNTIKLRVTDSAAKTSTVDGTVVIKSRTLVHEDWQDPLLANNTQFTTSFTGWTFNGGAYANRKNNVAEIPGDSSAAPDPNQVIQLNLDNTIGEINIAHNWAATDVYHLRVEASPNSWGGANQRWIRPELRQQNGTLLWAAPENSTTAVPLYNSYMNALTDYPSELTFFFTINASSFTTGAQGQPLRLRIDQSGQRALYINKVTLVLGPLTADTTPPGPDPLTWDVLPTVSNFTTISMRIGSARDPGDLYGVEYYFENITNSTNSGWQNSRVWVQTGLAFDTQYTYRVKARDKSPNQNESINWSAEQSATTLPEDLTPPSPDPVTWATVPTVADFRSITMTVNTATDPSGVEYYFENVTNSTNSGWIAARSWTQKDLAPNTLYTYRARARDKSLAQNESINWSTEQSATTPTEPANTLFITRFQDPLIAVDTALSAGLIGNWTNSGGFVRKHPGDGIRTDTDLSVPSNNQVVHFEYTDQWIEYNLPHNWSSTDTFTLTINASPQNWNGASQRYVRPSLRQQNGIVLWAPGEKLDAPDKTALPLYANMVGSSYQSDPNLSFSFTIPASAFTTGTEGQPIRLRIASSGVQRGVFIDNVHLSVTSGGGGTPEIAVEENAVDIPNTSGSRDFGTKTIGTNNDMVFTILNTGDADLNLSGVPDLVAISGDADFTVHAQPSTNPVPDGGSTTFTVRFNPQASGARSATVSIANDDSDENPFTFTVNGTGQTSYAAWATGSEPFDGDANGDGVSNGLAFLLGAAGPDANALGLLPQASESNGDLVLSFNCLPVAARGGASLHVVHSSDLGGWTATADEVPDDTNAVPDNDVTFVVGEGPVGPPALNSVTATIDSAAAASGKLFGGLKATE